jgi:hypothetical protein
MTEFERGWAAAIEAAVDVVWKVTDHETAGLISKKVRALQCPEQPAEARTPMWSYDISPPQGFLEYVAKNYSGEVVFHDPAWHALRLWNAAMRNAMPPFVVAEPAAQSADSRDAARWRAFRHLGTCGKDPEEILGPLLESLFPQNEERVPTGEEIDAVADGVVAALAQQAGKEHRNDD